MRRAVKSRGWKADADNGYFATYNLNAKPETLNLHPTP